MKKTKSLGKLFFSLLFFIFVFSACSNDFELYEGKALKIAVVGELPVVKEDQVLLKQVTFEDLADKGLGTYDAVLITEENLVEASEDQYAEVYLYSAIPFFFISAKSHVPFTVKETRYDGTWEWSVGNPYAVGVLSSREEDTLKSWGFGLYNDEMDVEHVKDVYSRIFKTIEELNL